MKRKPLHALPVAKGRAKGRRCIVCEKTKPYDAFGPRRRICIRCRDGKDGPVLPARHEHECAWCNAPFTSSSPLSTTCPRAECKKNRLAAAELKRRSRRRKQRSVRKRV